MNHIEVSYTDGPFRGGTPDGRRDAEILNRLYRHRRRAPRVEGLLWVLGRDECRAIRCVEPGSTGVRVDRMTGVIELFGLPVYECGRDSACLIVKAVEMEAR